MFIFICTLFYNWLCYFLTFLYYVFTISHIVLPYGLDVALLGVGAFYLTKLKQPPLSDVSKVLGPLPGAEADSGKVIKGIAHRGANLDAPENSLEAFKYCVENGCKFVEFDVHMTNDNHMVLCHDDDLQRLADDRRYITESTWASIKDLDVARNYHNKTKYPHVKLCLLADALDYLVANDVHMVIDIKSDARPLIPLLIDEFVKRPRLYDLALITSFNPYTLYQIRRKNRQIVGALSFRPFMFSAVGYEAVRGPIQRRFPDSIANHCAMRMLDVSYEWVFASTVFARWCGASVVFLHKDVVSPQEVAKWRGSDVRVVGWSVNSPVDKLYYSRSLHCSYLAGTLVAEPQGALASAGSDANLQLKSELDDPLNAMSKLSRTSIAEMTLSKSGERTASDFVEEQVGMARKIGEKKME